MSETRRNRDASARAAREAAERGEPAERGEAIERGEEVAQQAVEELREMSETVADTVVKTADAAAEMGQRAAEQGRDVMMLGVRTAVEMNGRLAEAGYGRSHRVLGAAAHALQVWHEAGENTADNVQALFSTYLTVGRGLQQMQQAWLDMLDHAMDRATQRPRDLLRCKSLEELAEVQRDLYLDAVSRAVESSSTLLQLAARTAQQAVRPLHAHAGNDSTRV